MVHQRFSVFVILLFLIYIEAYPQNHNGKFRLGVIDYYDSAKIVATFDPINFELAKLFDAKPELIIYSYNKLKNALLNGEVDMAVFSPNAYIDAKKEYMEIGRNDISVFASHLANGKPGYYGVIVVMDTSSCNTLFDLKGKTFLFTHILSTSGYKLPYSIFIKNGIEPSIDFKTERVFSGSHINSIRALMNGEVDGIATYIEALEQEPNINMSRLKILYKTGLIPYNAYVLSPLMKEEQKTKIKYFMFHAHEDLNIYNILLKNELDINQWIPVDDNFYNGIRPLVGVKRTKKHTKIIFGEKSTNVKDQQLDFLRARCAEELEHTDRFTLTLSDKSNSKTDSISINIYNANTKIWEFSVFYNSDLIFNLELDSVDFSKFPKLFVAKVLDYFPIKTKLDQDKQNNLFLIHYGYNDGINKSYSFEIQSGTEIQFIDPQVIQIFDTYSTFDIAENEIIKKGSDVHIVFSGEENSYIQPNQNNGDSLINGFWSKLDNIWGVIGIVVAIVSGTFGALFSYRKKRRFKKMLHEANYILKEYFDGKEIETNLNQLKTEIGDLFEKQYIQDHQYQFLKDKIKEIHEIILKKEKIPEHIKLEIKEITKDGIITEKEYNRLIALLDKEKSLSID